jgi:hypothetical protein
MDSYRGIVVVIPTRNRSELAMRAISSTLAQSGQVVGLLVSDNSTDTHEADTLARFCESLDDARLHYVRPPDPLAMSPHWDWVVQQALERYDADHITFQTDRIIFRPGAFDKLADVAARFPNKLVSYMHDKIDDQSSPVRVQLSPWSGKLYKLKSASLLDAVSQSQLHDSLPRMLNCLAPRSLLNSLRERFGTVFSSLAPDFSFCFRTLALEESFLFLDQSLIFHYALNRSNGASFARGELTRDSADFMTGLRAAGKYYAAPIPAILTVHNAIIHEYCVARDETRSTKFKALDEVKYLAAIANELDGITNPEVRDSVVKQLLAHGWAPPDSTDLPLWRKLVSPTRVWGKISRTLSPNPQTGSMELHQWPELREVATLDEALEFCATANGPKLEDSSWVDQLGLETISDVSSAAYVSSTGNSLAMLGHGN